MRTLLLVAAWTLAGLTAAAVALVVALPHIDLSSLAASRAAAALGRPVRIGALHVAPGRWIGVTLHDLAIPNPPGASRPDMLTTHEASAEVDVWSLLSGPLVLRHVRVSGFELALEHLPGGQPNWRRPGAPAPPPNPTPDNKGLPTILDATVHATIDVRTTDGVHLVTVLDGVRIEADGAAHPVRLTGPGTYKGVPVALAITFASFDALRAAPEPVPSEILLVSGDTRLAFKGTMRDPLNLDRAQGELTLDMPTSTALFRIAGLDPTPTPPLRLLGTLEHESPQWHLANTTGTLGRAAIRTGDVLLIEGKPDRISLALDFEALDLDSLLAATRSPGADPSPTSIVPAADPGTLLDLKLTAATLETHGLTLTDPSLDAAIEPGRWTVGALSFGAGGGQVQASGAVVPAPGAKSARAHADIQLAGIDLQAARRALGAGAVPLTGRIEAHVTVDADAPTLDRAAAAVHASAVLTLRGGSIAREVVEAASIDPRALFRSARGAVPVSCLLGLIDLRGPELTVAPLRIRSSVGTIVGRGRANLARRTLDLTVASESSTTSAFALDVPLHISGSFADPSIVPAELSAAGRAQLAEPDAVRRLPARLQQDARRSPCLERGR